MVELDDYVFFLRPRFTKMSNEMLAEITTDRQLLYQTSKENEKSYILHVTSLYSPIQVNEYM